MRIDAFSWLNLILVFYSYLESVNSNRADLILHIKDITPIISFFNLAD